MQRGPYTDGGFDAIIGNPPFLGGKKISPAMGSDLREWFVNCLAGATTGHADLVAYFFLRAQSLTNQRGTLGLIATNSIAEGDTREVGLDRMTAKGFSITRSIKSRRWPATTASVEYAAVWGTIAPVSDSIDRISDGTPAHRISTLLEPEGVVEGIPLTLAEAKGLAFIGSFVNGAGFLLTPHDARAMIKEEPHSVEVIQPYLVGDDVNNNPTMSASRWVIDFTGLSLDEAHRFRVPFGHVKKYVQPYRETLTNKPKQREQWWLFERPGPALRRAIKGRNEVLAIALVSKAVMPVRVSAHQVLSHMLAVFTTDSYGLQAVLSSSAHQLWAITYGSTLGTGVRYTPTDVFITFPTPVESPELEELGRTLDSERREMMLRRNLGLTDLYNLVNDESVTSDPDVLRLREIHVALDEAVMRAYGWDDVPLDHGFHTYRKMTRWTVSPTARVEILDRLLEENHRRAAEAGG